LVTSANEQIVRIEALLVKGKYNFALKEIRLLRESVDFNDSDLVNLLLLETKALSRLGQTHLSLQQVNAVQRELTSSSDLFLLIDTRIHKAEILYQLGYCNDSLLEVEEGEKILSDYKTQYDERSPEILTRYSRILYSRGKISTIRGDLNKALKLHQESVEIQEEFEMSTDMARTRRNIGWIYHNMGKFDLAQKYYLLSYDTRVRIGNKFEIISILFYLFKLSIDKNDKKQAEEYLEQIRDIQKNEDNVLINLFYRTATAILLKNSDRPRNKIKAEEIFEKIVQEEIIYHELTVMSKIYLCELLLFELQVSSEDKAEIMAQMKAITKWLLMTAKSQQSYRLLAETYLLKSRIAVLDQDIKKARRLLTQAQLTAEENGLKKLSLKISLEHDSFIQQLSNNGKADNGEDKRVEDLITQMNLIDGIDVNIPEEEPIALLIMAKNGVSLYAKSFNPSLAFKEQLMGGFLTAIHRFSGKIFSRSLDRAKLGEYTLLMRSEEPLLFSYVFKGQTYPAIQKLDKFIAKLRKMSTVWRSLAGKDIEGPQSIIKGHAKESLEIILDDTFIDRHILFLNK